jgi:hypothetical protein
LSSLYILKEEGPDVPKFYLKSTNDHRTILKSLEENGKLKETREKYLWPETEFKSMKFKNDNGIEYSINTMIQKPVDFISWKKYNLFICNFQKLISSCLRRSRKSTCNEKI